jgi:parallel beta-helix repeat protein
VVLIERASAEFRGLSVDATGVHFGILLSGAAFRGELLLVENAGSNGIHAGLNSHLGLFNSTIRDNAGAGVNVSESSAAVLAGNRIEGNDYVGINIEMSSSANVDANSLTFNVNGLLVTKMSSVRIRGNTIENNFSRGIWVAHQYGFLETFDSPSIIQNNGVDVECADRGIFESQFAQTSSTGSTNISAGCTVLGTIF